MITLTKLNGKTFLLNVLLIEQIESLPDTTITLTNKKKFIVKESEQTVQKKIIDFYKKIGLIRMVSHMEETENE
ncbi:flagellar FlbD family protein [Bacillus alveayuensis]|jgi:flagellar protein FlbD|uniref:Flagellar protein FlbD n=1 Tax=Aeribacillus alveayuensis TaxID=279215 RepID=A0ABT9VL94_9BACI|nr:flagellar FlbD family protein [Bacillus alveayuensis]MDQ0161742.1 flagellar protein FlbD [Bacillus alveayuensis]